MKLPIDANVIAAGPPEATVDFDTKTAKVNQSGQPIFAVEVVALSEGRAEVISVRVAGEPKRVGQGPQSRSSVSSPSGGPWVSALASPTGPVVSSPPALAGGR